MPSNENCAELFGIQEAESFRFIADNLSKAGWSWGCVSAVDGAHQTTLSLRAGRYLVGQNVSAFHLAHLLSDIAYLLRLPTSCDCFKFPVW